MKLYIVANFIVILISLFGLTRTKDIIKSIILINICQTSTILLFFMFSHIPENQFPIYSGPGIYADPFPQALMITTIVIGASITALALMFSIKIFHQFGTLNWDEIFMEDEL